MAFDNTIPLKGTGQKFNPLTIYDAPGTMLSLALDRELTWAGVHNSVMNSSALSPKERDTYSERLKMAAGDTKLGNTVIGIVTNPWVWFMVLTAPAGGGVAARAIKRGGSVFGNAKWGPFHKEEMPYLAAIRTASQRFYGTHLPQGMAEVQDTIHHLDQSWDDIIGDSLKKVLESLGVDNMSPARARGPKKVLVKKADELLGIFLAGHNKEQIGPGTRLTLTYLRRAKDSKGEWESVSERLYRRYAAEVRESDKAYANKWDFDIQHKSDPIPIENRVRTPQRVTVDPLEEMMKLDPTGALVGYAQARKTAMDHRYLQLFFRDGKSGPVLDEKKLVNVWRALGRNMYNGGPARSFQGADIVSKLMGPEVADLVEAGKISFDEWMKIASEAIQPPSAKAYLPYNIFEYLTPTNKALPPRFLDSMMRGIALRATGSAIPRTNKTKWIHPDDLEDLRKWGGTEALDEEITRTRAHIAKQQRLVAAADNLDLDSAPMPTRLFRLDTHAQLERYASHTAENIAMYVQPLSRHLQVLREKYAPHMKSGLQGHDTVGGVSKLWGQDNMSDVFYEGWRGLQDAGNHAAADFLVDSVIPRITSNASVQHTGALAAMVNTKAMMLELAESKFGQKARAGDFGEMGTNFHKRLVELGAPNQHLQGRDVYSAIAKYLYVTHLGLNLASTTVNLMQPLLLGATYYGIKPILYGYGQAFKELGGYAKNRVKRHGVGWIDPREDLRLIKENFRHANFEGDNLIGVGPDVFETLETAISGRSQAGKGTIGRKVFDATMAPFQYAEYINRATMGHAVEYLARKSGHYNTTLGREKMKSLIRTTVRETQFGSGVENIPSIFLPSVRATGAGERFLDQPTTRQFLSFPVRSVVGFFTVGPRLGDRGTGAKAVAGALGHDFLRLMGISSVVHEVAKGTFGFDVTRGLGFSSLTDIVGGDRFFDRGNEWIPVPPIADIPIAGVKALLQGDMEMMRQAVPRLLPAGIAFSRGFGVLGKVSDVPVVGKALDALQRSYVDWGNPTSEGLYPVYKPDGSLIGYKHGTSIIAKGLGLDLGKWQYTNEIDRFISGNREQIVDARHRLLNAIRSGRPGQAKRIGKQFEKRYGYRLTVTSAQVRNYFRNLATPRTERILNRIDPQVRSQFTNIVADSPRLGLNVGRDEFRRAHTARQRDEFRSATPRLTEEMRAIMIQHLAEGQDATKAFPTFSGF